MKFLILLLLPVFSFAQSKVDTVSILHGKVKILAPKELSPMPDEMWSLKYPTAVKPIMVLSDENGEVNFITDMTHQTLQENQIGAFKNMLVKQFKVKRPDMNLLSEGVKTVNGKKVGYFKFVSQAIDQKVFNYYFFTVVDGKLLLCTFNCIEKLQKEWENTADNMVASLVIK